MLFLSNRSASLASRHRWLLSFVAAAVLCGALALFPEVAAKLPWQAIAGCALLIVSIGGALSSAMRVGDLYADTLARSSWPGRHEPG